MPQLDLFTLIFQFKSLIFLLICLYFFLIFFIIPKIHYVIRLRRVQIKSFYLYYFLLKVLLNFYFAKNINLTLLKLNFVNRIYSIFLKNLISKFSILNLLNNLYFF